MPLSRRQLLQLSASLGALTASADLPSASLAAQSGAIIKPARLRPGMTVGLVTPASNVPEDEDLLAAMDLVRSLGFEAKASPNLRSRKQYLAGSDAQRADDLNAMFLGTLEALTASIDAKDRYTCGHSRRVALLTRQLAHAAGLDERPRSPECTSRDWSMMSARSAFQNNCCASQAS